MGGIGTVVVRCVGRVGGGMGGLRVEEGEHAD